VTRVLLYLLWVATACQNAEPESARARGLPPDFRLSCAFGKDSPQAPRTELVVIPQLKGGWVLLVRRSSGRGEWPRVWGQGYWQGVDLEGLARLGGEIQASGFFDLASEYVDGKGPDQESLTLEVAYRGRRHLVRAKGRQPMKLVASLQALDRFLPIRLHPWPSWLATWEGGSLARPRLVRDLERSLVMHRRWLVLEPTRSHLHLDLFALELALGHQDAARQELEALSRDKTLQGLVPELEALLR
jgi:hypothetical protein